MKLYGLNGQQWIRILAAWSGWLMDGYVSIAYLLMAGYLALVFFPANFTESFLFTVLGLAVGSIARSVGSLAFGNYFGDKIGRRNMLMVTVIGFSVFSFLIGLLPTYNTAGYLALALLYILLFVIGLFAGAEYGGGTALYAESVPADKRGFVGSFVQSGFGTGYFLAAGVFAILGIFYTTSQWESFGWRIVFFTTLIPGLIAIVTRFGARESSVFTEMVEKHEVEKVPIFNMIKEQPFPVLFAIFVTTGLLFINSGTFGFYPLLMSPEINNIAATTSGTILVVVNLLSLLGVWFGGFLSTRIPGRRLAMIIYSVIFLVALYPLTMYGVSTDPSILYITFSLQAFLEAMIFSTLPAFLAEKFSKRYRTTAVGFTYNAGGIVGGFAPTLILISSGSLGLMNSWFINLALANILLIVGLALSVETWSRSKARDVITD